MRRVLRLDGDQPIRLRNVVIRALTVRVSPR
jgi:hypothetical protein